MTENELAQLVIELITISAIIGVSLAVLEAFFGSGR